MVTLDPDHDTPEKLATLPGQSFNLEGSHWSFLVGNAADTRRLADLLGIEYTPLDDHVVHRFKIVFVSPVVSWSTRSSGSTATRPTSTALWTTSSAS